MGKVAQIHTATGPEPDPLAVSQQLQEVARTLDQEVEFGEPQDPEDPTSTTLAGGAVANHNGTIANIAGSWVEVSLTQTGLTSVICYHNLYLNDPEYAVPVSGEPNCRWLVFGVMHDGTGADATTGGSRLGVDVAFVGDAVNPNNITLRFNVRREGRAITVGDSNPVKVTLFFTRATRGE
jgi:hypothetical protein